MKIRRNISGVYVRIFDEDTGAVENICFEDLTIDQQDKFLDGKPVEYVKSLAKFMAARLNQVGEQFNIISA